MFVEANLSRELGREEPRGTILAISSGNRSSSHGKPVSYNTTPADRTIRSEDTYEKGMIQYANNLI